MEITRRKFIKSAFLLSAFSAVSSKLPSLSIFKTSRFGKGDDSTLPDYKNLKKAWFYKKL